MCGEWVCFADMLVSFAICVGCKSEKEREVVKEMERDRVRERERRKIHKHTHPPNSCRQGRRRARPLGWYPRGTVQVLLVCVRVCVCVSECASERAREKKKQRKER